MIKKQLKYLALWSFLLGLVVIVFLQVISAQNINQLIQSNQHLLKELSVRNNLRRLEMSMLTLESDMRGGVITSDRANLSSIRKHIGTIQAQLAVLNTQLSSRNSESDIRKLNFLVNEKISFNQHVVDTFFAKGKDAAELIIDTNRGKIIRDSLQQIIAELEGSRQYQLRHLIGFMQNSGTQAQGWGFVLALIACLFIALAFWYNVNQGRYQQRMITALNESEKKIKDAAKIKEQFMANMSHEIRTPMNAILGFTNLLQRTQLDGQQKNYVDFIQSSSENLLTLINDILDLSKIEAGMMHIEEAPFNLSGLLNSIETMFREKANQKGLQLTMFLEPNIPDALQGDAVRLTQILMNLLSNAIKFTDEGSVAVTVHATEQTQDAVWLRFSVKDTGIGIPLQKQQQIFERFRQAEADTTRRYGGTGLGLSIVQQLAELQHGKVIINSNEGQGSEFIVTLPYKVASTAVIRTGQDAPLLLTVKGVHVLVAEDNQMNQQLIRHLMRHWQLECTLVQTGNEVLDVLRHQSFSLILMDVQMPEMDGYTATLKIRNDLKLSIPIIAMTAHALAGEKEKCLSYGMNDYISKPIRENELYNLIKKYTTTAMKDSDTENIIDLTYLKELSKGDLEFENAIIRQFIIQVPEELELLQEAIEKHNLSKIKSLAHGMKSSVGYLGLMNKLQQPLQRLESEAVTNEQNPHFQKDYDQVRHICNLAAAEAKKMLGYLYV